jgi:hypothetical protein
MRKHHGMRPQDIVILLKIILLDDQEWLNQDLARSLHISSSEISESLNRSSVAGLIDFNKRKVARTALFEFLQHGLKFVFPQQPGPIVTGVATAHGHPYMSKFFHSDQLYVWPDPLGDARGISLDPLYPNQVKAIREDDKLYKLLAIVDVIRVGKLREKNIALNELEKIILP